MASKVDDAIKALGQVLRDLDQATTRIREAQLALATLTDERSKLLTAETDARRKLTDAIDASLRGLT